MLTEDDDLIRVQDIPERTQLATSLLSQSSTLSPRQSLTESDVDDAATWVTSRLSTRKTREFFSPTGPYNAYSEGLFLAASYGLRFLFIYEFEVPYIWTHRRDYISYFNPQEIRISNLFALRWARNITRSWNSAMLSVAYTRLKVVDEYFSLYFYPASRRAQFSRCHV